jgi:hypothetical protein
MEHARQLSELAATGRPAGELIGYGDRLSVEPGASISFMVSSSLPFLSRFARSAEGTPMLTVVPDHGCDHKSGRMARRR